MPIDASALNISFSNVMAGLIFGVIGLWLFRQGRQRTDMRLIFTSIALMVYSYFTSSPGADWGIGFSLCGLAYYFWIR